MDQQNHSSKAEDGLCMKTLTAHCFDSILAKLDRKEQPSYPAHLPDPEYPIFVTWTKGSDSELRGCIGTFSGQRLSKILGKYACVSAFQDTRFEPMQKDEVPHLQAGVSLLVNFTEIKNPLEWEVGKHGIEIDFVANGRPYSGTFLPEVAHEQGWSQKETLEYLVRKAGHRHGYDTVKESMKAKTYESKKFKMTYEEYHTFKNTQGI
eukprot:403356223